MKSKDGGGDVSALESLYEWFNDQLSRASEASNERGDQAPEGDNPGVVNTQKAFVQRQIREIFNALGATGDCEPVITVRKRFCAQHRYLRPVYAEPNDLNRYLTEANQQTPFDLEFGASDADVFGDIQKAWRIRTDDAFLCIHRVRNIADRAPTKEAKTVAERLTKFWQNNLMSADPAGYDFARRVNEFDHLKDAPAKELFCIFAGSLAPGEGEIELQIEALFGAYLIQDATWKPKAVGAALPAAADLFRGLELISQLDSKLFELHGLRIMAELLPKFVEEEQPRSDKISRALVRLEELLAQHLVGRPGWEGGEEPKLFYLSASFEHSDSGWFPRLEVYPHAYRNKFPLVSLLVSHARVPSTSKFLLKTYFEKHRKKFSAGKKGAKLDPAFAGIFSARKLGMLNMAEWRDRVIQGIEATCLHMVEHDEVIAKKATEFDKENPWKILNHSVDGSEAPSRSLLAFVIEGERGGRKWAFPRGILALESRAVDAFSDLDIEALRAVVKAFGSLIRLITHDNACLEYRTKLSKAFDADLLGHIPTGPMDGTRRKFVFSVRKIDGQQFHKLLRAMPGEEEGKRIWRLLRLDAKERKTLYEFRKDIWSHSNSSVKGRVKANEIVSARVEWALERVGEEYHEFGDRVGNLTPDVVEFLFACTENFQWSAYLSSLAQALGDRAESTVPDFQLMSPGYSASRMFMARVRKELRQVVKLSEYKKLSRERQYYKLFVRYRLVNAARMPANGFAFDGTGWTDERLSGKKNDRYGALVSDLIAAAEKDEAEPIKTYVRLLCECVLEVTIDVERSKRIANGIHSLFKHGMTLWREENGPKRDNVREFVRSASRLPAGKIQVRGKRKGDKERNERIDALNNAIVYYSEIYGDTDNGQKIIDSLFESLELPDPDQTFFDEIYQISHRDLNSRNLTWSGALTTFLMIDFEHVGPGYAGADQIRLWVNAICELYGEAFNNTELSDEQIGQAVEAVENLIVCTNKVFDDLVKRKNSKDSISDYVSDYFINSSTDAINFNPDYLKNSEGSQDYFATFFVSLFFDFPKTRRIGAMVMYSFYCNILKEFEYSCREVDVVRLRLLLNELPPIADSSSKQIHEALMRIRREFPSRSLVSLYFKHLTSARLLNLAFRAMASFREAV